MAVFKIDSILASVSNVLRDNGIAVNGLIGEWETRGAQVLKYREYYDGEHDAGMTENMRKMLRLSVGDYQFNDNYMPIVVDTLANRLTVDRIEGDTDASTTWLAEVLEDNQFDLIQQKIAQNKTLDGDAYLMIGYDNTKQQAQLTVESAYDGISGMIAVYESEDLTNLLCVIKIWHTTNNILPQTVLFGLFDSPVQITTKTRINIYYPDRIEKYIKTSNKQNLEPFTGDDPDLPPEEPVQPWVDRAGQPLGIPIVHFTNRPRKNWGISEIANAIPLQDALNRTLTSIVTASEKAGFPIRVAIGGDPDPDGVGLAPGDWVIMGAGGVSSDQTFDVKTLESGDLSQLLAVAVWQRGELANVTSTSAPEFFSANDLSGEAYRQREITLTTKVKADQVRTGAKWAMVGDQIWSITAAYGSTPPVYKRFETYWRDNSGINPTDLIDAGVKIMNTGRISTQGFLRYLSKATGWDQEEIDRIIEELAAEKQANAAAMMNTLPSFGGSSTAYGKTLQNQQNQAFKPPQITKGGNLALNATNMQNSPESDKLQ